MTKHQTNAKSGNELGMELETPVAILFHVLRCIHNLKAISGLSHFLYNQAGCGAIEPG